MTNSSFLFLTKPHLFPSKPLSISSHPFLNLWTYRLQANLENHPCCPSGSTVDGEELDKDLVPGPIWQEMPLLIPSPPWTLAEWLSDEGSQPAPRQLSAEYRGFHSTSPGQTIALYTLDTALAIAGGQQTCLATLGQGLAAQQDEGAASILPALARLLEVLRTTAVGSSSKMSPCPMDGVPCQVTKNVPKVICG